MKRTVLVLIALLLTPGLSVAEAAKAPVAPAAKKSALKSESSPRAPVHATDKREEAAPVDIEPTSWGNVKALWGN
jgi:hypothetical protein